jgi:hypothetical protein
MAIDDKFDALKRAYPKTQSYLRNALAELTLRFCVLEGILPVLEGALGTQLNSVQPLADFQCRRKPSRPSRQNTYCRHPSFVLIAALIGARRTVGIHWVRAVFRV